MLIRVTSVIAYASLGTMAVNNAAWAQDGASMGVSIVPTINLVAIIMAAVTVGVMFQTVRGMKEGMKEMRDEYKTALAELREELRLIRTGGGDD